MKRFLHRAGALLLLTAALPALRAAPADEVVVVYNSTSEDSRRVATHYAYVRGVSTNRLIGLPIPNQPGLGRDAYDKSLLTPLRGELARRELATFTQVTAVNPHTAKPYKWDKVTRADFRYIVLCHGVPFYIAHDATIPTNGVPQMPDVVRHTHAAIDSELAMMFRDPGLYSLFGPVPNPFQQQTNAAILHPTNEVVIVTRLDGPTPEIARTLVDKAVEAERDGLWGRAYFDTRSIATNDAYYLGDQWINAAHEMARRGGFECEIDRAANTMPVTAPVSDVALYVGWYSGAVDGPWVEPTVRFRPGAFAYHLHSYSAAELRSDTKNWTGPLLARGATASMGCVHEPLLGFTPNMATFIECWMARGMTFGEAALIAQPALSWQTTIIGDPLYRPFAQPLPVLHARLESELNPSRDWAVLHGINHNIVRGTSAAQLVQILQGYPGTRTNAFLLEKLGDLQDATGRLTGTAEYWELALKRESDPNGRARIALKLANILALLEKRPQAVDILDAAAKGLPNPKTRVRLMERQLQLLTDLKRTDDATRVKLELEQIHPPSTPAGPAK